MKAQEIVSTIMKEDGVTQSELATALGFESQQAVSNILKRNKDIKVEMFVKMINELGYKLVICKDLGKMKWEVD